MLKRNTISGLFIIPFLFWVQTVFSSGEVDHISYKFQYCGDNNDVEVVTNNATISKGLGDHVRLNISYLIDGITGASRKDGRGNIDGITSASPTDEHRQQISGTLAFMFDFIKLFRKETDTDDPMTFSITGMNSEENDYTSRTISAAISQDLFQRNTTIGVAYNKSFDEYDPAERFIPSANDEGWSFLGDGKRQTDRISASLTQGITTTTIASLIWSYGYDRGYLARPYYVYEIDNQLYHEHLPAERMSMTYTGRINQYIPTKHGTAVHLDYRYYYDSWDLNSHTISLQVYYRFAEKFIVRPSYRFYVQTSTFFYEDVYFTIPKYLTTDFKYRECITSTIGLKLIYEIKDFFKPEDSPIFSLFPINIDVAANYMIRSGTDKKDVVYTHYNYWSTNEGYHNFWVQGGIKFAF